MTGRERVLVVTGDDFGASASINEAVIRAHREGILTGASLMANGEAFEEAVALAREHPRLDIGVHLSLVRGRAVLPPAEIPDLVDREGAFSSNPVGVGFRYYFSRRLREQLAREMEGQIQKVFRSGLTPSYLDGHLHLHIHPAVLPIALELAQKHGIRGFRLPREGFRESVALDRSELWSKAFHGVIYWFLCRHAGARVLEAGLRHPDAFFGLLESGRVTERFLLGLLERLAPGVTEVGAHPAMGVPPEVAAWAPGYQYAEELRALTSPVVAERVRERGVRLASYRDAWPGAQGGEPSSSGPRRF